jgi:hypothetical protein
MVHHFVVESEAVKRRFSVYVVFAIGRRTAQLYVGKTGDDNIGCTPIIFCCGNYFSCNKTEQHESWHYEYVFEHFDHYTEVEETRKSRTKKINEMGRWLNQKITKLASALPNVKWLRVQR